MKGTLSEIARERLTNQLLAQPLDRPADVVKMLGAVQAQDYLGAKWAVAQRAKNAVDPDVERAFNDGQILRTHVLRPTWHFVAPEDIRWMLALTGPRINGIMSYSNRVFGLDPRVFRRSNRCLEKALAGGKSLTRKEISVALARAGLDVTGDGIVMRLLMRAEVEGVICSGPRRGKQLTYALLDERAPSVAPLARDEALLRLVQTYFATRGPATVADFAWWSGLTIADTKRGIDAVTPALEKKIVDGRTYWFNPELLSGRVPPSAHLLPNYDEFFIAYRHRDGLLARLAAAGVPITHDNLVQGWSVFANIAVVDGQVVAIWKRSISRKVVVDLKLISKVTAAEEKRLLKAARRYAKFLQLELVLRGLTS